MVADAEINILQGLPYKQAALVQFKGYEGQTVLVLDKVLRLKQFLFAACPQRLNSFQSCHHLKFITRVNAMITSWYVDTMTGTNDGSYMDTVCLAKMQL